ncbi:hypothetical protein IWQ60_003364, partial [Tieghemiomyces parasiticus]
VQEHHQEAQQRTQVHQARVLQRYQSQNYQPHRYQIDDPVLLRHPAPLAFEHKWYGPFRVHAMFPNNTYHL